MGTHAPADELPGLYRAILDRVAELEAAGERVEAARVRREATASYSRAWDEKARRQLQALLRHAARPTAAERLLGRGVKRGHAAASPASRPRPAIAPER